MREEARLREADDADSHHIAVAKFLQKVIFVTDELLYSCPVGGCYESMLNSLSRR